MQEFVILLHQTGKEMERPDHFDLMLQDGDALITWELDRMLTPGTVAFGRQLPNHRLEYLEYEGPISRDRGTVRRIEKGFFRWMTREPDISTVEFDGAELAGIVTIERIEEDRFRFSSEPESSEL